MFLEQAEGGEVAESDLQYANLKWENQTQLVTAATHLIACIREAVGFPRSSNATMTEPPMNLSDENLLDFKNPWCNACNTAATHAIRIKQVLGIQKGSKQLPGVPTFPLQLPIGMRIMHDTYMFIYLIANFLAVLLARSVSPDISPTEVRTASYYLADDDFNLCKHVLQLAKICSLLKQAFRHDGLIRLYTSYLIYMLAVKLHNQNPFGDLSFEHWHMFYFNDLQLWDRQTLSVSSSYTVRTNLRYPSRQASSESSWHNFGAGTAAPVAMAYGEQKSAVEIIRRVAEVVKRHWYVLDLPLSPRNRTDLTKAREHRDFHDWLPWKHDANQTVYNVTSNPAANLAPAPFCCINDGDFFRQNYDESVLGPQRKPYTQSFQIPLSLFFHRMYVNMDLHFGGRQDLHNAMARYLPDLYAQLQAVHWMETDDRTRAMLQERQRQEQVARERNVPSLGGI